MYKLYCSFMFNYLIHYCNFLLMNNCSSAVEVAVRVISHFHSLQVDEHCSLIEHYSNELMFITRERDPILESYNHSSNERSHNMY